jgi:pyruvate dehydrogenase E2 component (dihydrolipoamide acetyltransferase)
MPIEVKMAKLSPTMESGQMVKWLVKVGDKVKEGDTLAEIQTDKAVMPMESFDDGTVALLDVHEGEEIALGQRVLVLAKKGEDPQQVAAQLGGGGKQATPAPAEAAPAPETAPSPTPQPDSNGDEALAQEHEEPAPDSGRVRVTPLARKIAAEAGLDLARLRGSGPNGRIIREDVEAALQGRPSRPPMATPAAATRTATAPAPSTTAAPKPAAPAPTAAAESTRIPHSRMRKTIADRMLQAKQAAPEIHVTVDIRMDQALAVRERLNKQLAAEKVKLSVGDLVTKAVAVALRRHPALNASYEADAIVQHGSVNIGIAVALEGGLIVPVLPDADRLGLREIRLQTQALADAARQNKLTPKQMMGSTFTISNLGMFGVRQFDAILNLPEVGILAVGTTEPRPVVEDGKLAVGQVMTVTLTADHRAVDGATAAEFLRTLRSFLEEPAAMLL